MEMVTGSKKECLQCAHRFPTVLPDGGIQGACRFNPPTAQAHLIPGRQGLQVTQTASWPIVKDDDFCSKFEVKPIIPKLVPIK